MYHGSCPLLFSTGEGLARLRLPKPSPVVRLVEAVHAACSLTSLISVPSGSYMASFLGPWNTANWPFGYQSRINIWLAEKWTRSTRRCDWTTEMD